MKVLTTVLAFSAGLDAVLAAPAPVSWAENHLVRRNYTTDTSNQLTDGTACREVTAIYARGTWEDGNVGATDEPGVETYNDLAALIGEVGHLFVIPSTAPDMFHLA